MGLEGKMHSHDLEGVKFRLELYGVFFELVVQFRLWVELNSGSEKV